MIINDAYTIVQVSSFTIVTYDRKNILIIQATGGNMGPWYVLQFLFGEKSQKLLITQQPGAREKITTYL